MSNGLQHTATHCNTLQHTATELQHTATHCNTLQHSATPCNTLQHPAKRPIYKRRYVTRELSIEKEISNGPQHPATPYNTLQHPATLCNTLQHTRIDVQTDLSRRSRCSLRFSFRLPHLSRRRDDATRFHTLPSSEASSAKMTGSRSVVLADVIRNQPSNGTGSGNVIVIEDRVAFTFIPGLATEVSNTWQPPRVKPIAKTPGLLISLLSLRASAVKRTYLPVNSAYSVRVEVQNPAIVMEFTASMSIPNIMDSTRIHERLKSAVIGRVDM